MLPEYPPLLSALEKITQDRAAQCDLAAAVTERISADQPGSRRLAATSPHPEQPKPSAELDASDAVSSLAAAVTEQVGARRF